MRPQLKESLDVEEPRSKMKQTCKEEHCRCHNAENVRLKAHANLAELLVLVLVVGMTA